MIFSPSEFYCVVVLNEKFTNNLLIATVGGVFRTVYLGLLVLCNKWMTLNAITINDTQLRIGSVDLY